MYEGNETGQLLLLTIDLVTGEYSNYNLHDLLPLSPSSQK